MSEGFYIYIPEICSTLAVVPSKELVYSHEQQWKITQRVQLLCGWTSDVKYYHVLKKA